jgi:hypothetical protein
VLGSVTSKVCALYRSAGCAQAQHEVSGLFPALAAFEFHLSRTCQHVNALAIQAIVLVRRTGDSGASLKLLCKGKVITNDLSAPLAACGVVPGAKIIVMKGSAPPCAAAPPGGAGAAGAEPSTSACAPQQVSEVQRILQAVEAVSKRTSNPEHRYVQLFDQARAQPSDVSIAVLDLRPANGLQTVLHPHYEPATCTTMAAAASCVKVPRAA